MSSVERTSYGHMAYGTQHGLRCEGQIKQGAGPSGLMALFGQQQLGSLVQKQLISFGFNDTTRINPQHPQLSSHLALLNMHHEHAHACAHAQDRHQASCGSRR